MSSREFHINPKLKFVYFKDLAALNASLAVDPYLMISHLAIDLDIRFCYTKSNIVWVSNILNWCLYWGVINADTGILNDDVEIKFQETETRILESSRCRVVCHAASADEDRPSGVSKQMESKS